MMNPDIPYSTWQPLSLADLMQVFASAPFTWGVAGGYAVEQFLGASIREHSDVDVVVYRDEQPQVQRWLADWQLYAADPPGIPCIRIDVQLLYKARGCRPKDTRDFQACLPHLPADARRWLRDNLLLLYPAGHAWLKDLLGRDNLR